MIIFNTTYHADHSRKDEFISWLKNFYIPAVLEHGALQEPQLTRIFAENEEEGISLSLQFNRPIPIRSNVGTKSAEKHYSAICKRNSASKYWDSVPYWK